MEEDGRSYGYLKSAYTSEKEMSQDNSSKRSLGMTVPERIGKHNSALDP